MSYGCILEVFQLVIYFYPVGIKSNASPIYLSVAQRKLVNTQLLIMEATCQWRSDPFLPCPYVNAGLAARHAV